MKNYHLTQEHVLDLVKRLDKAGANLAALPEGGIEVLGIKGLQQLVNAALDQVLGEPVAEAFIDNFGDLKIYPIGIASKSLIVARGDSKLYALKEQT